MDELFVILRQVYHLMVAYLVMVFLIGVYMMRANLKTHMIMVILLVLIAVPVLANEDHVTVGLYTEHYQNDSDDLNEDNKLMQYTRVTNNGYLITGSTFINSHGVRTYAAGAGLAHNDMGFAIVAIHGYKGYLAQHYESVLFAPVGYYLHNIQGNHSIKINIVPTVANIGYDYRF